MRVQKLSIAVDFDLAFLKIRWSDHVLIKNDDEVLGEGVVYGGDWKKAEKLARQMADMKFGAKRGSLPVCEQIFIDSINNQQLAINNIIQRGSYLKIKVGRDVMQDIKAIEYIRNKLGFKNKIRLDANRGYSLKQLQYIIPTLKEHGISYVEEPVPFKDLPVAALLLHRYGIKVILDESLNLLGSDLSRKGQTFVDCIDAINIKLSRIGDITQALKLIKLAKKYQMKVVIGCSEELHRGMEAIYALGHYAADLGVLMEVEGFGPLRLRKKAQSFPRLFNRLENLALIISHRLRQFAFDIWWSVARLPIVLLKESKKLSSLSLRLVKLTGKYRDAVHPKHLISGSKQPEYLGWIKKSDKVLDMGCGNGQHTLKIAGKAREVSGFDTDAQQLEIASRTARGLGISNVSFHNASAEDKLAYKDREFNCVVMLGVLEHLNEREPVLREIHKVLKPGGILLLGLPNEMTGWKKTQMKFGIPHFTDPDHKVEYTSRSIRRAMTDAGFRVEAIQPTAYDTPWAGFIDVLGGISLKLYRHIIEWKWNLANQHPEESISFFVVARKSNALM